MEGGGGISPINLNLGQTQGLGHFILPCKGHCFLCLKLDNNLDPGGSSTKTTEKATNGHGPKVFQSLNKLQQYLSLDFGKLISNQVSNFLSGPQPTIPDKTDVMVELCEGCLASVNSFTKLHEQLEWIQMELNSWVYKLSEMIRDNPITMQSRILLENLIGKFHANLLEELRNETEKKCTIKLAPPEPDPPEPDPPAPTPPPSTTVTTAEECDTRCVLCPPSFKSLYSKTGLARHLRLLHPEKKDQSQGGQSTGLPSQSIQTIVPNLAQMRLKCPFCIFEFGTASFLTMHIKRHHSSSSTYVPSSSTNYDGAPPIVINEGAGLSSSSSSLSALLPDYTSPSQRTPLKWKRKQPLLLQQKGYQPQSQFYYNKGLECPVCSVKFSGETALRLHVDTQHKGIRYECPVQNCYSSFTQKGSLRRHLKDNHPEQDVDQIHLNSTRIQTRPTPSTVTLSSEEAEEAFVTLSDDEDEDNEKDSSSPASDVVEVIDDEDEEDDEEDVTLPPPSKKLVLPCKFCLEIFFTHTTLETHQNNCQKRRPSLLSSFKENNYTFRPQFKELQTQSVKLNLNLGRNHEDTHFVQVYPCPTCNLELGSEDALRLHEQRHALGLKEYPCGVCGEVFNRVNLLHKHWDQKHNDDNVNDYWRASANTHTPYRNQDKNQHGTITMLEGDNDNNIQAVPIDNFCGGDGDDAAAASNFNMNIINVMSLQREDENATSTRSLYNYSNDNGCGGNGVQNEFEMNESLENQGEDEGDDDDDVVEIFPVREEVKIEEVCIDSDSD